MEIEMRDIQEHEELIAGERYTITTGQVDNGSWWWESYGYDNSDGTKSTREAALKDAISEIAARTTRS